MRKKPTTHRDFWRDGFSIDESRVSVLMILMVMSFGLVVYTIIKYGDVPGNLVQIVIALITAVAGVNIADSFANRSTQLNYTGEVYRDTNVTTTTVEGQRTEDNQPTI